MATTIFGELPASQTNDGNIILSVNGSATTSTLSLSEIIANAGGGGGDYTAGINLKIDNGIIDIKNSGCSADATSIALGKGAEASGYSLCFGRADENKPHIASGEYCINLGWHSSAIGNYSTVLGGNYCLASGDIDPNDGKQYWGPIAQGGKTSAFGHYSHAEGIETIASGQAAHSEGYFTRAIGHVSHSDGLFTSAFAQGSYAHGNRTIASANYTFVIGTRNLNNSAAFVVGNGTSGATSVDEDDIRSDAFVVDWNGNVSATGDMYTSAGQVVTDVMLTSAANSSASFVTNGVADLTSLYTYIKSLEDRIAALEAAQGGDGFTVNGIQPTVNGNTITVGE